MALRAAGPASNRTGRYTILDGWYGHGNTRLGDDVWHRCHTSITIKTNDDGNGNGAVSPLASKRALDGRLSRNSTFRRISLLSSLRSKRSLNHRDRLEQAIPPPSASLLGERRRPRQIDNHDGEIHETSRIWRIWRIWVVLVEFDDSATVVTGAKRGKYHF